jgi:AcrR family transcriptional regulator
MQRASRLGLESVTVGDLARELEMSKSGVVGPFGSRALLLSTALDEALAVFRKLVIAPSLNQPPGLQRLMHLIDNWIDYLVECPFHGGCFVTSASAELDGRPGPLRDLLAQAVTDWRTFLVAEIHNSRQRLPTARAEEIAMTLIGISMAANQELQLLGDASAAERARRAMQETITSLR